MFQQNQGYHFFNLNIFYQARKKRLPVEPLELLTGVQVGALPQHPTGPVPAAFLSLDTGFLSEKPLVLTGALAVCYGRCGP